MEEYKRIPRLYIPESPLAKGKACPLSAQHAHYLRHVMRRKIGDPLRVFNGLDGEWLAHLGQLEKNKASINVDKQLREQENSSATWALASPIKKEAFDLMIEKACELGAQKFIPLICDRTVVHKINRERLQCIAIEAAEQCERLDIMSVEMPRTLKELFLSGDYNKPLFYCLERGEAVPLAQEARRRHAGQPCSVLIGPEGGFSSHEIDFICNAEGVVPVSLGHRILRAETAMIAALSIIQLS